jgi:hypothetical protein
MHQRYRAAIATPKLLLLPLVLTWLATATSAIADDEDTLIIFPIKSFVDTGTMVHVEGTLAGEGIGYKNNRSALTCFQERHVCISIHVEAQGRQIIPLDLPGSFTVQLWTDDRIIADFSTPCGPQPVERKRNGRLLRPRRGSSIAKDRQQK